MRQFRVSKLRASSNASILSERTPICVAYALNLFKFGDQNHGSKISNETCTARSLKDHPLLTESDLLLFQANQLKMLAGHSGIWEMEDIMSGLEFTLIISRDDLLAFRMP